MRRLAPLVLALIAGCGTPPPAGPAPHQIRLVGASAGLPFAEDVAERFTLSRGDTIAPLAQANGTTRGIARFCGGLGPAHPDLVIATRPMTVAERRRCAAAGVTRIAAIPFGWSALVLAARPDAGIVALTRAQAAAAIAGGAARWSEIGPGLPAAPIAILGPAPGSADGLAALLGDRAPRRDGAYRARGADAALAATEAAATRGAVALLPYAYAARPGLRAIAIDGVLPAPRAIADGRYRLRLPLLLLVKSGEAAAVPGMPALLGLFARSLAPGGGFAAIGLVPLDPVARAAATKALASAGAAA